MLGLPASQHSRPSSSVLTRSFLTVNLQLVVTTIYVVTYVLMDPVAGSLAAAMVLFLHKWTFGEAIDKLWQAPANT